MDARQVAAETWRAIKRQHDGWEIRLRDLRDFGGQYALFRRNVQKWNKGDEQSRLLTVLRDAWVKRSTNQEAKSANSNHTIKMTLTGEHDKKVVKSTKANVAGDLKRRSLRNVLLITVSGDCENAAIWCLDECEVDGQAIRLQPILAQMSCDDMLE